MPEKCIPGLILPIPGIKWGFYGVVACQAGRSDPAEGLLSHDRMP